MKIPLVPKQIEPAAHRDIYSIGTPAALQIILAAVSNAVLLRLMSSYAVAAISGMGVMQKVESIPFQAIMGISNGILPMYGLMLVQPFMELCGCMIALVLYGHIHKQPQIEMKKISGGNQ